MRGDPPASSVAFIGAGTIARAVAAELERGVLPGLSLHGFLCRGAPEDLPGPVFADLDALLGPGVVVVEAAGHEAVRAYVPGALAAGTDVVCVSVGALADGELRARVLAAAAAGGTRLLVPSGAVGGLDLLRAAAAAGLDEVVLEQRKPPHALLSAPEAEAVREPCVLFEGSVTEAVRAYPQTTNIAAAVALAGRGFELTRVRVVADPALAANRAVLRARGAFGAFELTLDNVASANPRTSAIVAPSIVATLRALCAPLVVPA